MSAIHAALAFAIATVTPVDAPPSIVVQAAQAAPSASAESVWGTLVGLSGREWSGESMLHRFVWDPATQTLDWQQRPTSEASWNIRYHLTRTDAGVSGTLWSNVGVNLRVAEDGAAVIRTREMMPLNVSFRAEGDGYRVTYNPFGQSFLMTPVVDGWTGASLATPNDTSVTQPRSGPILVSASGTSDVRPARDASQAPTAAPQSSGPGPIVLASAPPPAAAMREAPRPAPNAPRAPAAPAPTSREAQMAAQVQTRRVQAAREAEAERARQAQLAEQRRLAEEQRLAEERASQAAWSEGFAMLGAVVGGLAAGTYAGGDMTAISAGMAVGAQLGGSDTEIAQAANTNYEIERERYEAQQAFEAEVHNRTMAALNDPTNPLTQQSRAAEEERKARYDADMATLEREQREMEDRHALEREQLAAENNRTAQDQQAAQQAEDDRREREQRQAAEERRREQEAAERRRQDEERRQQEEERRQAAERERQEREEQQRREAEARRLEAERREAERNRLVDFREAVVLCQLSGPQARFGNWDCEGPLQQNYVNFDKPNAGAMMRLMDCGSYRELPGAGGYRVFACGYGLHPNNPAPSRNVPEMLGVVVGGRATFRCPISSTSVCRSQ